MKAQCRGRERVRSGGQFVVNVILAVVETPGIVQALADGDGIPQGFVIEAEGRVWPEGRHESMPALAMVELVIADIRHTFGANGAVLD